MRFYRGRGYGYRDVRFAGEETKAAANLQSMKDAFIEASNFLSKSAHLNDLSRGEIQKRNYEKAQEYAIEARSYLYKAKRIITDNEPRCAQTVALFDRLY